MRPLVEPIQVAPWVVCQGCGRSLPFATAAFEPYFSHQAIQCPLCSAAIDWWSAVLESIREHFMFGSALELAGARRTIFHTTLKPNEVRDLKLPDFGVPEDADVLDLNLTSAGSALPVVLHGNQVLRDPVRPYFELLGRPLPDQPGDGALMVSVTWFVRKDDDTTIRHLVHAAEEYGAGRFDAIVVPANIAAEGAITPVVKRALQGFASAKNLEDFLENAATYSHQLNVLLPVVASLANAPRLPDHIRGFLNRLRRLTALIT